MINAHSTGNLEGNQEDLQSLMPDLNIARRFLKLLAQHDEIDEFTFQIFPEGKEIASDYRPKVLHGSFDKLKETLVTANLNGCGIFVTINRTDGKGRKAVNIVGIRAVFVDLDGSPLQPVLEAPLSSHIVIESSSGRYHAYWLIEDISCDEFTDIQKALASQFGGDPQICDRNRVMRLPGFFHLKRTPYKTTIISESGQLSFKRDNFLNAFKISPSMSSIKDESDSSYQNPVLQALIQNKLLVKKTGTSYWMLDYPLSLEAYAFKTRSRN